MKLGIVDMLRKALDIADVHEDIRKISIGKRKGVWTCGIMPESWHRNEMGYIVVIFAEDGIKRLTVKPWDKESEEQFVKAAGWQS